MMDEGFDYHTFLARKAVTEYTMGQGVIELPEDAPAEFRTEKRAVFVSLHKHGELRGCIGTLEPCYANLGEEIIHNAVAACSRDPRFPAVRPDELAELDISVDVLSPLEPIAGESDLDPKRYGVVVSSSLRRGVLLPDLEGIDTVADQVRFAKVKAGIRPGEPVRMQRFTVERHE